MCMECMDKDLEVLWREEGRVRLSGRSVVRRAEAPTFASDHGIRCRLAHGALKVGHCAVEVPLGVPAASAQAVLDGMLEKLGSETFRLLADGSGSLRPIAGANWGENQPDM